MQGTTAVSGTFFVAVKLANNRGPVMAKIFLKPRSYRCKQTKKTRQNQGN